jgi:ADP-ribose pyrophosphatase YjhB (NUDIX family)
VPLSDDLAADGEPENEYLAGISARLPRKGSAASALIRDGRGRFVMVEPCYKATWEPPGGVLEEDESPLAGCRREVAEELGLDLSPGRLLVVDWVPRRGPWHDALLFIFDGGVLDDDQLAAIRLPPDELRAVHLVTLADVVDHVRPSGLRRLTVALDAVQQHTGPHYLEFGRLVPGGPTVG